MGRDNYGGPERREQWYSNKEIFEMVQELRDELKTTREIVKKYNGIREDLNWCVLKLQSHNTTKEARYTIIEGFREWGGWLVALAVAAYKIFG